MAIPQPSPPRSGAPVVAVVGTGAAGTLAAIHLAATAGRAGRPLDLLLVDDRPTGRGVAYGTSDRRHRLNVPAARMSAWPDDPDHFRRWLVTHADPAATGATFAARADYGRYLADTLDRTVEATSGVGLERVPERAISLTTIGRRWRLGLDAARSRPADAAVLALGNGAPDVGWAPDSLRRSPRFVPDPWAPGALWAMPDDAPVLLVGSSLTMADVVVALGDTERVVHVVSRHGLGPLAHRPDPSPAVAPPVVPDGPLTWPQVRRLVVGHIREHVARGEDWRAAVDGLRLVTTRLWQAMPDAERRRFLAVGARRWDQVRHRVEPAIGEWLQERVDAGRLVLHAGEIVAAEETTGGLRVGLSCGEHLDVGAVVACTGPRADLRADHDALVLDLLTSGTARPGEHDMGLATDDDGRVLGGDGGDRAVWTLGPMRRGQLWESTAVPEIRQQAAALAAAVLADLPGHRVVRRPRDTYGLPLSTTPEAAELYGRGLGRVLRVQDGAEDLVAAAVAADPGFALGHAALALLGHEGGADGVDVEAALAAAAAAVDQADERERRFVQVARDRIRRPGARSAAALIAHIQAYPEDALAVSVAVPTIAFGGATELPQEAWALVEGLAPAYGDDWWYRGLLAFMRQEQQQWDEAMALAEASLAAEPHAGHAAHAKTHVHYETGDHVQGLAWLNRWITASGRATAHGAHYSWHAALHELATGQDDAAAGRYAAQLAPPRVTGVRALVDSVSLLWRGYVDGAWDWPEVGAVLDTVEPALLREPPTPFVALHVAVALTAGEDAAGLARLREHAAGRGEPVFRETVAPLADALLALVRGDAGTATDRLLELHGVARLGGSAAQQDVVEGTLLYAAMTARRRELAQTLLRERLERRPSPRDAARLAALTGPRAGRVVDGVPRRPAP
ncbi:FAD/NAD(P)-binding protein [Jatrophihabitans sp. YIM 134969]